MANLTNSVRIEVTPQVVKFKPGGPPASFEVKVFNESDQFATFEVNLRAEGTAAEPTFRWYHLSPEISAKKPPGDSTKFTVTITDNPVPGFVGTMNVMITVACVELRNEEERQIIRLVIEPGLNPVPLQLSLLEEQFEVLPGQDIAILAQLHNPSHLTTHTIVRCAGLDPTWLMNGVDQPLQLKPKGTAEVIFRCHPPENGQSISQVYPFTIVATQRDGRSSEAKGQLEVLPIGPVMFICTPPNQEIPARRQRTADVAEDDDEDLETETQVSPVLIAGDAVAYDLTFQNRSNLSQQVTVNLEGEGIRKCDLKVVPERATVPPHQTTTLSLLASRQRPWLGTGERFRFKVEAVLADDRTQVVEAQQDLTLHVKPIAPAWLQLVTAFFLMGLLGALLANRPGRHTAPVNSVQLSGNATQVVSGSNDQTIRRWRLERDRLVADGILGVTDQKAVRVVRYRPLENNLVAAGLENGEIQIWPVLPGGVTIPSTAPLKTLAFQGKADRVLSLAFSRDARFLFSGHGSGLALQWNVDQSLTDGLAVNKTPIRGQQLNFAISDMALVGPGDSTVVIGGRYNRLVLWPWTAPVNQKNNTQPLYQLPYPTGDQNAYIFSLATAEQLARRGDRSTQPNLLATGDNQGNITLWDLRRCLGKSLKVGCEVQLDRWNNGHGGKPVRSVALSANGCYLASVGDDGRAMLWALNGEGERDPSLVNGQVIRRGGKQLNAVSITVSALPNESDGWVVSGGDDHQVRLHRFHEKRPVCR